MPNGQYPAFSAGQILTASLLQSATPLMAYKTGDTSRVTNTTLSADPDLTMAVAASASYYFRMFLDYEGGTQGSSDFHIGFSVPTGTTMRYGRTGIDSTGAVNVGTISSESSTPTFGTNGAGTLRSLLLEGTIFVSTTPGTVSFEWCQGTSNGVATIVHKQSGLVAVRLA